MTFLCTMNSCEELNITNLIISLIKKNKVHDDLLCVKTLYLFIKTNKVPISLKLYNEKQNIFVSICTIICNKLKIYLYHILCKTGDGEKKNLYLFIKNNLLLLNQDAVLDYDICNNIHKACVTIELFLK